MDICIVTELVCILSFAAVRCSCKMHIEDEVCLYRVTNADLFQPRVGNMDSKLIY